MALEALEQALHFRSTTGYLVHHGKRGEQYLPVRYRARLADAGIEGPIGGLRDA